MSSSIKDLTQRLSFATIPVALVLASAAAIWLGAIHSKSKFQSPPLRLPSFNFQASEQRSTSHLPTAQPEKKRSSHALRETHKNIFGIGTVAIKEESALEIMELALGLIVVKGENRFCLTNGVMIAEGGKGMGFQVHRIEENRVWYRVGESFLSLQPGERKSIDTEGNISEAPDTDQNIKASGLKMNETQVVE